jgi:hypothetical protein
MLPERKIGLRQENLKGVRFPLSPRKRNKKTSASTWLVGLGFQTKPLLFALLFNRAH